MSNLAYLGKQHALSDGLAKSLGKIMKKAGMMSDDDYADMREEFRLSRSRHKCSDGMCGAEDCERCHPEGMGGEEDDVTELSEEELAEQLRDEACGIVGEFRKSEFGNPTFVAAEKNLASLPADADFDAVARTHAEEMLPLIHEWYEKTPLTWDKRPWDTIKGVVASEVISWIE